MYGLGAAPYFQIEYSPTFIHKRIAGTDSQRAEREDRAVVTHSWTPELSDAGHLISLDRSIDSYMQGELQAKDHGRSEEAQRMAAIGMMACSISHDMRHFLSIIYADVELLGRHNGCASSRIDLLIEIQEAVHRMTERIDSLLQFGRSGRNNPFVHQRLSSVIEKAIAAVRLHPDGRDVSIKVGKIPDVEANMDARNLESAIYNLLLNACQAAICSSDVPDVDVHVRQVDEQICVAISDNGPGIPACIRRTLFSPFVTAGKSNGTGLGLTLARRVAEEHGGSVCLVESNPGRTVFALSLMKNTRDS